MTKEEKQATIKALLEERRGYLSRDLEERVKEVDAQLRALGHGAQMRSKQAERRPSQQSASTR